MVEQLRPDMLLREISVKADLPQMAFRQARLHHSLGAHVFRCCSCDYHPPQYLLAHTACIQTNRPLLVCC